MGLVSSVCRALMIGTLYKTNVEPWENNKYLSVKLNSIKKDRNQNGYISEETHDIEKMLSQQRTLTVLFRILIGPDMASRKISVCVGCVWICVCIYVYAAVCIYVWICLCICLCFLWRIMMQGSPHYRNVCSCILNHQRTLIKGTYTWCRWHS